MDMDDNSNDESKGAKETDSDNQQKQKTSAQDSESWHRVDVPDTYGPVVQIAAGMLLFTLAGRDARYPFMYLHQDAA